MVCVYRDNEVDAKHPVHEILLSRVERPYLDIAIKPFDSTTISRLICDAINEPYLETSRTPKGNASGFQAEISDLSAAIHMRTQGNQLFTTQACDVLSQFQGDALTGP